MTKSGTKLGWVLAVASCALAVACDTPHKPPMTPDSEQVLADLDASAGMIDPEPAPSSLDAGVTPSK